MLIVGLGLVNKDIVAVVPSWKHGGKHEATRLFEQVGGPVPVALATMARLGLDDAPDRVPRQFGILRGPDDKQVARRRITGAALV